MSSDDSGCGKLGDWKTGVSGSGWVEIRDAASILHSQRVCHDKVALGRRANSSEAETDGI